MTGHLILYSRIHVLFKVEIKLINLNKKFIFQKTFTLHLQPDMIVDLSKKRWQWAILLTLAMVWGSSFILMKKGLKSFSNDQVAAMRLLFAFLTLLPLTIKKLKFITRKNIGYLLILGIIGNGFPAFFFVTAQKHLTSSVAGILNSLTPLFTVIIGGLFFKSKFRPVNIIGVFIALSGTVALFSGGLATFFTGTNWYALLIVIATLFYGINVNNVKINLNGLDSMTITALTYFIVGPIAGVYLLFSDFTAAAATPDYIFNLICIVILAVFGSALASLAWNLLIKHTSALAATSVTYIIPFFAIIWGMLDGESMSLIEILAMLVILVGVYLVNIKDEKQFDENSKPDLLNKVCLIEEVLPEKQPVKSGFKKNIKF